MTWRNYDTNLGHDDDPSPAVIERGKDENYARDLETLTAIYRSQISDPKDRFAFAAQLSDVAARVIADYGGDFEQQVFDDHGPQAILRALAKAYEAPDQVVGPLEGD